MVLVKYLQAEPGVMLWEAEVRWVSALFSKQACMWRFLSSLLPYEGIVSWHMEESGRVTVGLISWHGFHHSHQLPPVTTTASQPGNIWRRRVTHTDHTPGLAPTLHFCMDAAHDSVLTSSPTTASSICPWWCSLRTPATSTPPACRWRAAWPQWSAPASARSWSPFLKTTTAISPS